MAGLLTQLTEADLPGADDPKRVRQRKLEATQRLLGTTIGISDVAWQEPSLLPGWTRAHVATHIARNADAFTTAVEGVQDGHLGRLYPSEQGTARDIERGSERSPLELQIDLDTSAGRLNRALDNLDPRLGTQRVELASGEKLRLDLVPLARLYEVSLHHVDLDSGFGLADIEEDIAAWSLLWVLFHVQHREGLPAMELHAASGLTMRLGADGDAQELFGPDWMLLGWLTGRLSQTDQLAVGLPLLPSVV